MSARNSNTNKLLGKRFCIVGKISNNPETFQRYNDGYRWWYGQSDVSNSIRNFGGVIKSGYQFPLHKACDYVVLGENLSSKTTEKLALPEYSHIIPITHHQLYKIIKGEMKLPKDKSEYEKMLLEIEERRVRQEEEKRRLDTEKKIKTFAAKCGIEYNTRNPELSVYKNKKMDVYSEVVLEKDIEVKPQPRRLKIEKGKYPYVKVELPSSDK